MRAPATNLKARDVNTLAGFFGRQIVQLARKFDNPRSATIEPGKHQAINVGESHSLGRSAMQHIELVSKEQDFSMQRIRTIHLQADLEGTRKAVVPTAN